MLDAVTGTIDATKSLSTSPDGVAAIADIIFVIAPLILAMNAESRELAATGIAAQSATAPIAIVTNRTFHIPGFTPAAPAPHRRRVSQPPQPSARTRRNAIGAALRSCEAKPGA